MPRSSRSFLFPDVNVWVALTYGGHEHHDVARVWFDSLDAAARVCFCRFTQISLLRLLTTPAVMGADEVMTQVEAWEAYERWKEDDRVLFLEEPPNVETAFRALTRQPHPNSKNWADAYLAAFATVLGMQFVTFDRAFEGKVEPLLILRP
jgi:toxin-antitoxin system PIN domain toxin